MPLRTTMPLEGLDRLDPAPEAGDAMDRDRAARLVSEGELFYVDMDEGDTGANRHDHGHLTGVCLEEINEVMAVRTWVGKVLSKTESVAETEAASRSTSQDSSDSNDSWRGRNPLTESSRGPLRPLQSIPSAWDNCRVGGECVLSRSRVRSFSESQLNGPAIDYRPPPDTSSRDHVAKDLTGVGGSLSNLLGARKVEALSRHLGSSTSTKTFDVSTLSETDKATLARLGAVFGVSESVTFTMHISGFRVVSSILGRHAEFDVRVKGDARSWSRWRRFSSFKLIAALVEHDRAAMRAWRRVLDLQPHFRCLDAQYLGQKCRLLELLRDKRKRIQDHDSSQKRVATLLDRVRSSEQFLQQVMFAMPTPALLIYFVSER